MPALEFAVRFFGYEASFRKAGPAAANVVDDRRGGWWPIIREAFTGAFQRDIEWTADTVAAHSTVYSCITLIAADIGKLRTKLVELGPHQIWDEVTNSAHSPVLRKPNHFQNHIQFKEWWVTSKLMRGNAYVLLQRDNRRVVTDMYLLDPTRVTVLVAPAGEVFYKLSVDNLSGLDEAITVPASEIIHDRMNCLFHPLVGTSPIFACGVAANLGLTILKNSNRFFGRGSSPSGILTAPGRISKEEADRLADHWNTNFSGEHAGRVAVVGEGLKFEPMRMTAVDSQVIQQLRWTAETVCSAFHVPPFKVGIGNLPAYNNAEMWNQIYYSDCLQSLIESMEQCLDEGLGIDRPKEGGKTLGVELDLEGLLRMDTAAQMDAQAKGVGAGFVAPNEARRRINLRPVKGGDTPYLQQQNYSLAALDRRDRNAPAPSDTPPPTSPTSPSRDPDEGGDKAARYWQRADQQHQSDTYAPIRRMAA